MNDVRERLKARFANTPRPDPKLPPRPMPVTFPASVTFSPLTDEIKAQQEADRIKYNLPF